MKILFLISTFIICSVCSLAQTAEIDTLKIIVDSPITGNLETLNYPIFKTGKEPIDLVLNQNIKDIYTQNSYKKESVDSALIKFFNPGIIYLAYEIKMNSNNI